MKKIGLITMIAAAAISFAACNSEPKDSKETADSLNEIKDSTNTADSTSTMASSEHDAEFATEAAAGGMSEVEFGKAALTKSTNAKVKEFANMMVNDHGKANQELMLIAKSKNISLPTTLDEKHQKALTDLNSKNGADFDKKYVDLMVDDHQKTLDLMEKQSEHGMDAELTAFAKKTAPIVKAHLEMIKNIKKSM